jgi:hypothetical protein
MACRLPQMDLPAMAVASFSFIEPVSVMCNMYISAKTSRQPVSTRMSVPLFRGLSACGSYRAGLVRRAARGRVACLYLGGEWM